MQQTGEIFLGRYHCVERLGPGPLGEIFRARLYGLGGFEKEFLLTRLSEELTADAAFLERLVRAARLASELHGDRLQRLHEIDADLGRYYVVSEWVRGVELGKLLDLLRVGGERLPLACALGVVLDVAEGLIYAHGRTDLDPHGVAYVGLSPRRLVVEPEGAVRLLDGGLLGTLVGSAWDAARLDPAFVAPEVRAGGPIGPAADIYSLGALLAALAGAHEDATVDALVKRMREPDRALRIPSVVAIREALLPLCDRSQARLKLAELAARYLPAALPPMGGSPIEWETNEFDRAPTNVAKTEGPLTDVVRVPRTPSLPTLPEVALPAGGELDGQPAPLPPAPAAGAAQEPPVHGPTTQVIELEAEPAEIPTVLEVKVPLGLSLRSAVDPRLAPIGPKLGAPISSVAQPPIPAPITLRLAALRCNVMAQLKRLGQSGLVLAPPALALLTFAAWSASPPPEHRARPAGTAPLQAERPRQTLSVDEGAPGPLPSGPPGTARLQVATEPAGATVWIDGEPRGASPLELPLPPGQHRVTALLEGHRLADSLVVLPPEGRRLQLALPRALLPAELTGQAGLKVRCLHPGELRILVDGVDTGRSCPNESRVSLKPGDHRVSLYSPRTGSTIAVQKVVHLPPRDRSTRIYLKY